MTRTTRTRIGAVEVTSRTLKDLAWRSMHARRQEPLDMMARFRISFGPFWVAIPEGQRASARAMSSQIGRGDIESGLRKWGRAPIRQAIPGGLPLSGNIAASTGRPACTSWRVNRHDIARWCREFAPIAAVANDAMIEEDRARAIRVLCGEYGIVSLWDAVKLTEPQLDAQVRLDHALDAVESRFLGRQLEVILPTGVVQVQAVQTITAGQAVTVNERGQVVPVGAAPGVVIGTVESVNDDGTANIRIGFDPGAPATETWATPAWVLAQTDAAYIAAGVLSPVEVAEMRFRNLSGVQRIAGVQADQIIIDDPLRAGVQPLTGPSHGAVYVNPPYAERNHPSWYPAPTSAEQRADLLTIVNGYLAEGVVRLESTAEVMPEGLARGIDYTVSRVDGNTFSLSAVAPMSGREPFGAPLYPGPPGEPLHPNARCVLPLDLPYQYGARSRRGNTPRMSKPERRMARRLRRERR